MEQDRTKLADSIRRVVNKLIFLEKRSVLQHGSVRLYPSEIHLMQAINERPDMSAGDMAQMLGVTNGAISQTLARLERKGIIKKAKDPSLKNRVSVVFTEPGKEAIKSFEKARSAHRESFANYLTGLSNADRQAIGDFLSRMEQFLEGLG